MPDEKVEKVITDFPSNSKSTRKHRVSAPNPKPEERHIEKVVSGKVIKQKKGLGRKFAEAFVGDDSKNVGEYVIYDVLIPAAKDTIVDMVKGAIEMLMFGEKRSRNIRRDSGRSHTSYGSYFKTNDREREPRDDRRDISKTGRARHDFDEVILESRGEAEEVLSNLVDFIIDYGQATVADFYDLVGITTNFADNKWGWTDLRNASVSRVRGGYLINLPRTQPLD